MRDDKIEDLVLPGAQDSGDQEGYDSAFPPLALPSGEKNRTRNRDMCKL